MATQYGARVLRAEGREQQPGRHQDCDHYVQHRPAHHAAIAVSAVGRAGIGPPESRKAAAMTSDWVPTAPRYQLPLTSVIAGLRSRAACPSRYREGQPQPRQQRGLDRGRGGVLAGAGEPVPAYVARPRRRRR